MQDKKQKLDECLKNIREFFPETPDERIQYMKMYIECIDVINSLFVEDYEYMKNKIRWLKTPEFIIGREYYSQVCNGHFKHIIEIYDNKCAMCGFDLSEILEVNHIIPKNFGGKNDETNLIALCPSCHRIFHKIERSGKIEKNIEKYLNDKKILLPFTEITKHLLYA